MDRITKLAELIRKLDESLTFTMLEIGGVPLSNNPEPFHRLVDLFPGSEVYAFEVDKDQCDKLNQSSKLGIKFFANALGRAEETRPFYETQHPMCSSLYEPNEKLLKLFTNFEVVHLKSVSQIETVSLDFFTFLAECESLSEGEDRARRDVRRSFGDAKGFCSLSAS